MIAWMQKNNKYLVPTIWIATIAFIGAGAVGWGSMNFGEKASSVAKVGDVSIAKTKYLFTYNNIYAEYARRLGNKFDKELAKKLGLEKQVFNTLVTQAYLLNLAKEYGIVVTEEEIAKEIASYPIFKDKNGVIQKSYYENFLRSRGLKAREFEAIIKDDLIVKKLMKLLDKKAVSFEKEVIASTFLIADKIKYAIVSPKDVKVTVDEKELKKYWQENKLSYLTPTKYKLDLLITKTDNIPVTQEELEKYYKENSFDFVDKDGKTLPLESVKDKIEQAVKLKKARKEAIISRNKLKKGKIQATKTVELAENDPSLSTEIWKTLQNAQVGEYLKPKPVNDTLVTVYLREIKKPEPKSFEAAKEEVKKDLIAQKTEEALEKKAQELIKQPNSLTIEPKEYISLSKFQILPQLTPRDSQLFIKNIFASDKKVDKVKLSNSIVVYSVEKQKLLEDNKTVATLAKEIDSIKSSEFNQNLITNLAQKYRVEKF
jgi:peptidyl-prolyl cis-trans isomerase D